MEINGVDVTVKKGYLIYTIPNHMTGAELEKWIVDNEQILKTLKR